MLALLEKNKKYCTRQNPIESRHPRMEAGIHGAWRAITKHNGFPFSRE